MATLNHVTVITRRASRRLMAAPGERRNLCGGALTDRDLTIADARAAMKKGTLSTWVACAACRKMVEYRVLTEEK